MWKKKQNKTKYHAKFLCPVKPGGLNVMMTFKFNFFLLRLPENFFMVNFFYELRVQICQFLRLTANFISPLYG